MSILNLNIGILGHVDSGKTTLCKALSQISSTAAFDKSTQSQERGITLDLGFSALLTEPPSHLQCNADQLQLTFVDCPGHASLIRTIIGGSQIIDFVILVVDVTKGIQTQTAECLVIAEITCPARLIVALNKTDLAPEMVDKTTRKIKSTLSTTKFKDARVVPISAAVPETLEEFLTTLKTELNIPARDLTRPFLFAVDHCFVIKGQGTVCTGTVLQGRVTVNQEIEIPKLKITRKVKSMQMFRRPVDSASQGDRVGICLTQFSESQLERGILSAPGLLKAISVCRLIVNRVKYFKFPVRSKAKYHFSLGHETVMGKVIFFEDDGRFIEEPGDEANALIEFEKPVLAQIGSLLIASKLDSDVTLNACRLAFHGRIEELSDDVKTLGAKVYKEKCKEGVIQRVVNEHEVIATNLFKKESDRQVYVGLKVALSTGEHGVIEGTFGKTNKIKVKFANPLSESTMEKFKEVKVKLEFKKFYFDKSQSSKIKQ